MTDPVEYYLRAEFDANYDDMREMIGHNKMLTIYHFLDETHDKLLLSFELNRGNEQIDTIDIQIKIRDLFQMLAELCVEGEK